MPNKVTKAASLALILGVGVSLSACTESRLRLSDDFGHAVGQNMVTQVADPDAAYKGQPAPASSGSRAALAQGRYETGSVLQPTTMSTSSVAGGGSR